MGAWPGPSVRKRPRRCSWWATARTLGHRPRLRPQTGLIPREVAWACLCGPATAPVRPHGWSRLVPTCSQPFLSLITSLNTFAGVRLQPIKVTYKTTTSQPAIPLKIPLGSWVCHGRGGPAPSPSPLSHTRSQVYGRPAGPQRHAQRGRQSVLECICTGRPCVPAASPSTELVLRPQEPCGPAGSLGVSVAASVNWGCGVGC